MTLAGYVLRDLLRNPRRTLASLVGVVVGVGLFSAVLFFIDGSGASMTRRAVTPLTLDMQRVLTAPVGGGVTLERELRDDAVDAAATTLVTLTVTNEGLAPAHEVVIRDRPSAPLEYVRGSTTVDGKAVADVGGAIPLSQGNAGIGLNIGTVGPVSTREITYGLRAQRSVPATAHLAVQATISTREAATPTGANAARKTSLKNLATQVRRIPGVKAADPLVFVDMTTGAISAHGVGVPGPIKLFAFDASYQTHYPSIKLLSGRIRPGGALVSAETARALKLNEGDAVTLRLPGRAKPMSLKVSGIADLSGAKPLFESRESSSLETFKYVPYSIVVDPGIYGDRVAPVFEEAAAARGSKVNSLPLEELDVLLDRSTLNADPATALAQTRRIATAVKSIASNQDYVIDNISNTLQVARGDARVAKRMFIFLGLPGAILAAILTAYAGTLLAEAQRRENALLRVRGASRRDLLNLLALRTISIAGIGSVLGTVLGFLSVLVLLGRSILFEASAGALLTSASISVVGGMLVTAAALYLPGRRLVTDEIKQELAVIARRSTPRWRRLHLDLAALVAAGAAQLIALNSGAFDAPAGSVYEGRSVSLPLHLLVAPLVAWLAGTLFITRVLHGATARISSTRSTPLFKRLLPGLLWRSITRRLAALTGGALTVGLVVGLGTTLACFASVYDKAKSDDARFLVGSDIRLTPNPTSAARHPTRLATTFRVDGSTGATAVVFSPENAVLTSDFNEDVATLAAIDPGAFIRVGALEESLFVDGSMTDMMSALLDRPDGVLVNAALAEGLKLETGDHAKVLLARGTDQQIRKSMKILGLFTQFPGAPKGTDMVANVGYYEHETGRTEADYYLVSTADRSTQGINRTVRALSAPVGFSRRFDVQTAATALDKEQSSLTGLNVRGLLQLDSFFTFLMAAIATAMF
ncbi:MAG: FtsX-like permease family protein, partial [Solirubrobacteraceae bacterium]